MIFFSFFLIFLMVYKLQLIIGQQTRFVFLLFLKEKFARSHTLKLNAHFFAFSIALRSQY